MKIIKRILVITGGLLAFLLLVIFVFGKWLPHDFQWFYYSMARSYNKMHVESSPKQYELGMSYDFHDQPYDNFLKTLSTPLFKVINIEKFSFFVSTEGDTTFIKKGWYRPEILREGESVHGFTPMEINPDSIPFDISAFSGTGYGFQAVLNSEENIRIRGFSADTTVHFYKYVSMEFKNGKPHGKSIKHQTNFKSFVFNGKRHFLNNGYDREESFYFMGDIPETDSIIRTYKDGVLIKHEHYELKGRELKVKQKSENENGIVSQTENTERLAMGFESSLKYFHFNDKKDFYSRTRAILKCTITWDEARAYSKLTENEFIAHQCFNKPDSVVKDKKMMGNTVTVYHYKNKLEVPYQARAMHGGKEIVNWSFYFSNGKCFMHSVYKGDL